MDMLAMLNKNTEINPPNYFFIDIQKDQKETFIQVLDQVTPEADHSITPLVRSRLHSIDEKPTNQLAIQRQTARGMVHKS